MGSSTITASINSLTSNTVTINVTTALLGGAIQGNSLTLSTAVSTLAGSGVQGTVDGTGTAALFYGPRGITTDGSNLYVTDRFNHKIRKIVIANGVVTTLAGSGTVGTVDGTGTVASFSAPSGLTTDGTNLYVADSGNHRIRKIVIATGVVTTLAGSGTAGDVDATGVLASFNSPQDITTDGNNLYMTQWGNSSYKIRKIEIATGVVTTLAGSGIGGAVDGTGTAASFSGPAGITTDGSNLYVADTINNKIRKIVIATGVVTTLAGSGSTGATDGTGTSASFFYPQGITTDGNNLYLADTALGRIRKIVISTGVVTTLAGSGGACCIDATGNAASFGNPQSITTDGTKLYVSDNGGNKIRKIE